MSHKIFSEIIEISSKTLIKFKYTFFYTNETLFCKKCNSNLLLKRKTTREDIEFLEIQECSNKNCITHDKLKRTEYWKYFFPKDVYEEKIKKINSNLSENHITNINMWIKKGLTKDEAIKKISELQSNNSKKNIKNRFKPTRGYNEEEINNICLMPSQVKFWINKGFSEKESKKYVSINQSYASKHINFNKRIIPLNIEYWLLRGFNIDESILKVKDRQRTFSKEICIQNYGEEKGINILNKRNEKWLKSLYSNGNMSSGFSRISQELFDKFGKKEDYYFYATKNHEISLKYEKSLIYLYDFTDEKNKLIIEYNGDIFHANPKYYKAEENYHPFNDEISKTKWKKDAIKINVAKKLGYDVLIIWDSEYREDKEKVINKCKQFLNIK